MKALRKLGVMVVIPAIGILCLFMASPIMAAGEDCVCGPGDHWIDNCPPGEDVIDDQEVLAGIDILLNGKADKNLRMKPLAGSTLRILRFAVANHSCSTQILELAVEDAGDGIVLEVGTPDLNPSFGTIVELADPALCLSTFDIWFKVSGPGLGGGVWYNHVPIHIEDTITCVPPKAKYIHLAGGIPLHDIPPGTGDHQVGTLVEAVHLVNHEGEIPTLSEWGMIIFCVLLFAWMAWMVVRRKRTPEVGI